MPTRNKYANSLLSLICVVSWFVIFVRIFTDSRNEGLDKWLLPTILVIFSAVPLGGIVLVLIATLKNRNLRTSFIYNFFGSFNMMVGVGVVFFPSLEGAPTPYMSAAALTVGIAIYTHIYRHPGK